MSTRELKLQIKIGESWYFDTTGMAEKILADLEAAVRELRAEAFDCSPAVKGDLCEKTGVHPIAVLMAALVLLKSASIRCSGE